MCKKPVPPPAPVPTEPLDALRVVSPQPITHSASGLRLHKDKKKQKSVLVRLVASVVALLVLLTAVGFTWYQLELRPIGSAQDGLIKVTIRSGASPSVIGAQLKSKGVIRSQQAFAFYTRLTHTQNKLQAGTYRLSPGDSTQSIVGHLVDGNVDSFSIQFLPGATLVQNREVLKSAGYSDDEVDTALAAVYTSPLFDSKPAGSDLEGYIYGETYKFSGGVTVEEILNRTFSQYEQVISDNDLVAKFKAHNLTLYQGITLASIIQREALKGSEAQIAQVFYSRLAINMMLGSDVTYQYIADKTGVARDTNLDSPYNTRRYTGLPPGPISAPGLDALEAVADPAAGDYLYFLAGDDRITYYARTLAEHEANAAAHCVKNCSTL